MPHAKTFCTHATHTEMHVYDNKRMVDFYKYVATRDASTSQNVRLK